MSYELDIEAQEDFLHFRVTGERSRKAIFAVTVEILDTCYDRECSKALIDVRELSGRLPQLEAYDVASIDYPKLRRRGALERVSIVDLTGFEDSIRFFETVACNRGFNLRIFGNVDDATFWLRTGDLPESAQE